MIARYLFVSALLASSTLALSDAYKWTNSHGNIHYSDKAPTDANAEKLELVPLQPSPDNTHSRGPEVLPPTRDDTPEPWVFRRDSRRWELANEVSDADQSTREYVLPGQTVQNWQELVTSQHLRLTTSPRTAFHTFRAVLAQACARLNFHVLAESEDTIIFEWTNDGCAGQATQHEMRRISRDPTGLYVLAYAHKLKTLPANTWNTWLLNLADAVISPSKDKVPSSSRSLPTANLGPLPTNTISRYLKTEGTGFSLNWRDRTATYVITVSATSELPFGAYLEAHFQNPTDPATPLVASVTRQGAEQELFLRSPPFRGLKCWNYPAVIYAYRGSSKASLLGMHIQTVQSRVNLEKIQNARDLLQAAREGNCP